MSEHDARIRVERADWHALLPWLALFRTARMALHPAKLGLALLLVILLYLGGQAMDVIWGTPVYPGEVEAYRTLNGAELAEWREAMRLAALAAGEAELGPRRAGVFETAIVHLRTAFGTLVHAAVTFDFGVGDFLAGRGLEAGGTVGALGQMFITVPGWLISNYPGYLLVYLAWAFIATVVLGGAIARLAALHACLDRRGPPLAALRFVAARYPWFFLAPLIPLGMVMLIALALMLAGLLFNAPGLEVVGALGYGLLLFGGAVAALLLVGLGTGGHLLLPALAVEGTDAFDAISRAYNYVFGRPWQYFVYTGMGLVYGAVVYLALSLVIFVALWLTWRFTAQWVFAELEPGVNRFEAVAGEPSPARLLAPRADADLGASATVAAVLVGGWSRVLVALLPAFAISFYFCVHTWIYLLLRRAADGTELDDLFTEPRPEASVPPEKLEPAEG